MRKALGVIWPAAIDRTEAVECKEEKGGERQVLPPGIVECVCH